MRFCSRSSRGTDRPAAGSEGHGRVRPADLVHEAIALHAAVGKAAKMAPEIALVHFGAGMDVVGLRAEDLSTHTVRHVVEAYPRHGFKKAFSEVLEHEVRRKPLSHMAGHMGLGFSRRIQSAPFAE
jgi:hypothetical protein